jgi:carboxypeptidase Taq
MTTAYLELERRAGRIGRLRAVGAILHWDMATGMPAGAAESRGEEMACLDTTLHEMATRPDMADLVAAAEVEAVALDPWRRANLREIARIWRHAAAVPADLVARASKAASRCEVAWREARPANDFPGLLPLLAEVLASQRELAAAKGAALGLAPYDALLDLYEPGGRDVEIARVFAPLIQALPELIDRVLAHQARQPRPTAPKGPFPIAAQEALARRLMAALGFDFARGRLDVSHHPFCGGTPDDVRVTTRYTLDDFRPALMGVLHETGHALYEAGLPADWRYQPVGDARGMSVHESQSLLVEMQVCRSLPFMRFAAPLIADAFGADGPEWSAENLHRLGLTVARSLIRVDADEVTYPAHVLLRWRLERAMIAGDLSLADLPGAWNDGMVELVGIRPPDDRDGCLQDIHWPSGAFGYFPTYTLGAMTAAQLFQAARTRIDGLDAAITCGDFAPLVAWLRDAVHGQASLATTTELLTRATGGPLDPAPFLAHLEARYLS